VKTQDTLVHAVKNVEVAFSQFPKIVGVTTLDCVRASKFVGQIIGKNLNFIDGSVIGGCAGVTIMPVFSEEKRQQPLTLRRFQIWTSECRMLALKLSMQKMATPFGV
jgi:malate/lactate dehydrogenase